jgi:hypothetical protein
MPAQRQAQVAANRVERLIEAYDAGCRSANHYRRFDEQRGRELAKAAGFTSRDEMNCFLAALRNHC